MHPIILLAGTEDAAHSHSLADALPHMAGMLMVMCTLAVLWGVCVFTARMVRIFMPEKPSSPPGKAEVSPVTPVPVSQASAKVAQPIGPEAIDPEIVAVIAAAVATVTGNQPVRIVSIKPMSTSWERAGRQSVLTSHRIR